MVPHHDRSGVVIEPWLTDQWYSNARALAAPALAAVEDGRTRFVPRQWENTFFDWMRKIQPWCISRQLWWGHQIPAWYGPDGAVFVAETEEDARRQAIDRMVANAASMGANAVTMMRFDSTEMGQSKSEIVAYGTARIIEWEHRSLTSPSG